uniref:RNA helicase n=1 Tax=Panagrolaimus superbus TaxID=310955 RepID=A0A914XVI3_9BILA
MYDPLDRDLDINSICLIDEERQKYKIAQSGELEGRVAVLSTLGLVHRFRYLGQTHFSHIILDEASQSEEIESLTPLALYASAETRVIIAGDPKQLGPIVLSDTLVNDPELRVDGTILKRLQSTEVFGGNSSLMVMLRETYHPHAALVEIISHVYYDNQLICHDPAKNCQFERSSIIGNRQSPILFVNVDGTEAIGADDNAKLYNEAEARALFEYLTRCMDMPSLQEDDVAVITPYNGQVANLRGLISNTFPLIEVDTVEHFQGAEKRVVLISTVRTTKLGFLEDPRRFCTAITHAKQLLIVIGNAKILALEPHMKIFLRHIYDIGGYEGINGTDFAKLLGVNE